MFSARAFRLNARAQCGQPPRRRRDSTHHARANQFGHRQRRHPLRGPVGRDRQQLDQAPAALVRLGRLPCGVLQDQGAHGPEGALRPASCAPYRAVPASGPRCSQHVKSGACAPLHSGLALASCAQRTRSRPLSRNLMEATPRLSGRPEAAPFHAVSPRRRTWARRHLRASSCCWTSSARASRSPSPTPPTRASGSACGAQPAPPPPCRRSLLEAASCRRHSSAAGSPGAL